MAMRFALKGLEKSNVTIEMKCSFKEFVSNRQLIMCVAPSAKRSPLPACELWDERKVNVLDILKQAAMQSYPDPVVLNRGLSQDVKVSYVYSCSRFFIQLKNKEDELANLMSELQEMYAQMAPVQANTLKEGEPCCALFEGDGQWYRVQVLGFDKNGIKVRYIDYGNEEIMALHNLRKPQPEYVTGYKPQAIECCLNGYQNMEVDSERDNLLEELILEREFSMKVVDIQDNRVLVELFDSSRYNVSSLLLEKIAEARSQVSPLLIQDGNTFEHRKREPKHFSFVEGNSKQKSWGNKTDKDSWRQGRSPR